PDRKAGARRGPRRTQQGRCSMNARMLAVATLVLAAACAGPGAAPEAEAQTATRAAGPADAAATITAEEMRSRIAYLASDELGGRDTPSPGLELAAEYISRGVAAAGLEPRGGGAGCLHRYAAGMRVLEASAGGRVVEDRGAA